MAVIYLKKCFIRENKLSVPVISVGNITVGGTGKTPLVMYIAEFFQRQEKRVIVACSGGAERKKMAREIKLEDEALMVKKNFPKAILTAKKGGEIKKEICGDNKDVVILDDGFHCHCFYKDLNILLVDMTNPFDNNMVLPSGLLREPKRELQRADIFVLSHYNASDYLNYGRYTKYLQQFKKPIFTMEYKIESLRNNGQEMPPSVVKNKVVLSFAGIGHPFNFFSLLSALSPSKIYGVIYPDHFCYKRQDVAELEDAFLEKKAEFLITTEKDYVKLKRYEWRVPVSYLRIKPMLKNINGDGFDTLLLDIVE